MQTNMEIPVTIGFSNVNHSTLMASVIADGVKTYAQILNELYNECDVDVLQEHFLTAALGVIPSGFSVVLYHSMQIQIIDSKPLFTFSGCYAQGNTYKVIAYTYNMAQSGSTYAYASPSAFTDASATVPPSGTRFEIYY